MKFVLVTLSFLFIQQFSFAQTISDSVSSQLQGRWDVVFEKNGALDQSLVEDTKKEKVESNGNHNIALLTYKANGEFGLLSIQNYSATDESGTFVVSKNGKSIVHSVTLPNTPKVRKRTKLRKRKAKILYIKGDVLVLKTKRGVLYMKRTD